MRRTDADRRRMSSERHLAARRGRRTLCVVAITLFVLTVVAGGLAYSGYRYDQNRATRILPGVRVAGVDVSGMTRSEAEAALKPTVAEILDRRIGIQAGAKTWQLTAGQLGTRVDVQSALDQAFAVAKGMS